MFLVFGCSYITILSPWKEKTSDKKEVSLTPLQPKRIEPVPAPIVAPKPIILTKELKKYCHKIDKKFTALGWKNHYCHKTRWHHVRNSNQQVPLIWAVFGDEEREGSPELDTTLILCGVHGDEITPIKLCFDIIQHMTKIFAKEESPPPMARPTDQIKDKLVIVAPIVNPDSFFKKYPTRTNANKIDINRNFPTKDWQRDAIKMWKTKYRRDKRRYPGSRAMSEPEVIFQVNLIKRYNPSKIISVHAPLTMLDYDGPASYHAGGLIGSRANQLLIQMSEKAEGYRIKNYPFFPGSLGNYAGNERNIPTYTLELPSSDNRKSRRYWLKFKPAIYSAILLDLKDNHNILAQESSITKTPKN